MPLRLYKGRVAFHRSDDVIFIPYEVDDEADDVDGIVTEAAQYADRLGVENVVTATTEDLSGIGANQIVILAHGAAGYEFMASGHPAGSGDRRAVSATAAADALIARGLPQAFAGNILVWSCFSGAAGGIAESVAGRLRARGRVNASVYGSIGPTSVLASMSGTATYLGLTVISTRVTAAGNVDTSADKLVKVGGWHGVTSYAAPADLRLAKGTAGLKAAEW